MAAFAGKISWGSGGRPQTATLQVLADDPELAMCIARTSGSGDTMKNVHVLYFAAVRELTGTLTEELVLPDEVRTVHDFIVHLGSARHELKGALASVRVAKNEIFAGAEEAIEAGDTLALIPPVQGG